jgi:hypothetical protein
MNGADVQPGLLYAVAAWQKDVPLRPVTALRASGRFLIYAGPSGAEWAADLSRVPGPWHAHADARGAAEAEARLIRQAEGYVEDVHATEVGYADFRVVLICTVGQARQLTQLLAGAQ